MATRAGLLEPAEYDGIRLLRSEAQPPPEWFRAAPSGTTRRCAPLRWAEAGSGWLAVEMPSRNGAAETDAAILATLAHLVVAAVQSSHLLAEGERLRAAATSAYEEMSAHAARLDETNRQLREARSALARVREKEAVEAERERMARELHDQVTQRVLAIGMALELCRGLAEDDSLRQRLSEAQELARGTVETIRNAIFELSAADELLPGGLVPSLRALVRQLPADAPRVSVRSSGAPVRLALAAERALLIVAREALFNVVLHSGATAASVRVAYRADLVELSVTDNGTGDAAELARHLHEALRSRSGYHRGLSFVYGRIRELGGTLGVSPARVRGVRVTVRVPLEQTAVSP
jgi:signal transduction histidine kinase